MQIVDIHQYFSIVMRTKRLTTKINISSEIWKQLNIKNIQKEKLPVHILITNSPSLFVFNETKLVAKSIHVILSESNVFGIVLPTKTFTTNDFKRKMYFAVHYI